MKRREDSHPRKQHVSSSSKSRRTEKRRATIARDDDMTGREGERPAAEGMQRRWPQLATQKAGSRDSSPFMPYETDQ